MMRSIHYKAGPYGVPKNVPKNFFVFGFQICWSLRDSHNQDSSITQILPKKHSFWEE
jgi:hypothetical protein